MDLKDINKIPAVQIAEVAASLFGIETREIHIQSRGPYGVDFEMIFADVHIWGEYQNSISGAMIASAAKRIADVSKAGGKSIIPFLVVPFMGEVGKRVCKDLRVSWFDLSGNAYIESPKYRIDISGRPNKYRRVGRPSSPFAAKSSRIARLLLEHPNNYFSQKEIASATGLSLGFVSRIVKRLYEEGLLVTQLVITPKHRYQGPSMKPRDPALLLEAWREGYSFFKHDVRRGHVSARSGDVLARSVCDSLASSGVECAATGLAAAWFYTKYATFRIASIFVAGLPSSEVLNAFGWREVTEGANLWLVVPNDAGVFQGVSEKDGVPCVHPVQVYLDLKDHPERAVDAAEELRNRYLNWD